MVDRISLELPQVISTVINHVSELLYSRAGSRN